MHKLKKDNVRTKKDESKLNFVPFKYDYFFPLKTNLDLLLKSVHQFNDQFSAQHHQDFLSKT